MTDFKDIFELGLRTFIENEVQRSVTVEEDRIKALEHSEKVLFEFNDWLKDEIDACTHAPFASRFVDAAPTLRMVAEKLCEIYDKEEEE